MHTSFRSLAATLFGAALLSSCSHQPPEGFAPDPGLVSQIRDIRIVTAYARACPGVTMPTTYEAILMDGSRVPFSRTYDKKHPPRLHVVFLDRTSARSEERRVGKECSSRWSTD